MDQVIMTTNNNTRNSDYHITITAYTITINSDYGGRCQSNLSMPATPIPSGDSIEFRFLTERAAGCVRPRARSRWRRRLRVHGPIRRDCQ